MKSTKQKTGILSLRELNWDHAERITVELLRKLRTHINKLEPNAENNKAAEEILWPILVFLEQFVKGAQEVDWSVNNLEHPWRPDTSPMKHQGN